VARDQAGNIVPDSQGGGWVVESQLETVDVGPDGRPQSGIRVAFVTDRGIHGSVFVPRTMYNPVNVKAAISEYVQRLHAVDSLSTLPPAAS
jgi:hypothetical protein